MYILKKGHRPGVYVPLRALFLVRIALPRTYNIGFYEEMAEIIF